MKTKYLKNYLDAKQLSYVEDGDYLKVHHGNYCVAEVGLKSMYRLKTYGSLKMTEGLYRRLSEFAATPLTEREDVRRYYLKNMSPLLRAFGRDYLLKNKDTGNFYAGRLGCSEEFYQTTFTESEISQMDITGFEKIEVTP